jgi:hypothetical protein
MAKNDHTSGLNSTKNGYVIIEILGSTFADE